MKADLIIQILNACIALTHTDDHFTQNNFNGCRDVMLECVNTAKSFEKCVSTYNNCGSRSCIHVSTHAKGSIFAYGAGGIVSKERVDSHNASGAAELKEYYKAIDKIRGEK